MQHLVLLHDPLKNLRVQIKSEIKEVLWQKSGFQIHATFSFVARPPQKPQSGGVVGEEELTTISWPKGSGRALRPECILVCRKRLDVLVAVLNSDLWGGLPARRVKEGHCKRRAHWGYRPLSLHIKKKKKK